MLAFVDSKLFSGVGDGYHFFDLPGDGETWRIVARGIDEEARAPAARPFDRLPDHEQDAHLPPLLEGRAPRRRVGGAQRRARLQRRDALRLRGVLLAPVGVERDRVRGAGLPARVRALRQPAPPARRDARRGRRSRHTSSTRSRDTRSGGSNEAESPRQGLRADAAGQRLGVPARPAPAGPAEPRPDGALPRAEPSTCRSSGPAPAGSRSRSGSHAAAGGSSCSRRGPSGIPTATGSRDEKGAGGALLDGQPRSSAAPTRSRWARTTPASASAAR